MRNTETITKGKMERRAFLAAGIAAPLGLLAKCEAAKQQTANGLDELTSTEKGQVVFSMLADEERESVIECLESDPPKFNVLKGNACAAMLVVQAFYARESQ